MRKRSKIGSLVQFTKALGADDEVVVVRKTDFTRTQDGRYVLSKNASIAHFAKADLDSDGYDDAADDTAADETGPVSKADASGHAQNAMDSHDDWHKVAGQKECNCDRDDDAPEVKGKAEEGDEDPAGDDDMGKNASRRRRRDALRKRTGAFTKADVEKTLTGMFAEFAKSFDEKFEKLGVSGESAPRKNGDGTLVKRDSAADDESDPIVLNKRSLDALHAKRDELLKKGTKGLSDQDRSEREALAKEISNTEMSYLALTGSVAR